MEGFSLLRYWRTNGGDATRNDNETTPTANTIVTGVSSQTSETEDEESDDHGPFFDLEFSLPGDEIGDEELVKNCEENEEEEDTDGSDESEEDESELKLKSPFQPGSSGDSTADVTVSVSPSDDLFFNGGFVPVEQTEEISLNPPESRVSLMKSATKFRVMMLKLKKSKLKSNSENHKTENEDSGKSTAEDVPVVSLFKRRNSSKQKKRQNENESVSGSSEEKKFTKKAMQEYLRKVKPLYVRVSQRYGEKLKFTGQRSLPVIEIPNPAETEEQKQKQSPVANSKEENESILEASEPPLLQSTVLGLKQGNLPAGLRVVCKHLRKSRSAFTAVAASPPPAAISSNRRDDSLLQQQDGIQSAILHCKRSFKASRDSDCSSSSASEPASQDGKCENSSNSDVTDGKEMPEINKS